MGMLVRKAIFRVEKIDETKGDSYFTLALTALALVAAGVTRPT